MRGRVAAGIVAIVGALSMGGCVRVAREQTPLTSTPQAVSGPTYDIVQGRDAARVARLRAAAAQEPHVSMGASLQGDERLQRARGLVRIGIGHYPPGDAARVREHVVTQARTVGADQALLYPPSVANGTWLAEFYVRLQLPFGANFRDLTDAERTQLGDGVEIGDVVGGTPASEANLREGDYVLKFDGKPIADRTQFQALLQAHMGRRVTLTIRRNGVTSTRLIVLGKLPASATP